jgi:hypothetical protein
LAESVVMTGRIGILSRLIFAALSMYAGMGSAAHADKRVALVIGNSAYPAVPALPNPAVVICLGPRKPKYPCLKRM